MRLPNDYYLIVDMEATRSDTGTVPGREMEIIEIGAVIQSSRTFMPESVAPPFPQAIRAMKQWMGDGDA